MTVTEGTLTVDNSTYHVVGKSSAGAVDFKYTLGDSDDFTKPITDGVLKIGDNTYTVVANTGAVGDYAATSPTTAGQPVASIATASPAEVTTNGGSGSLTLNFLIAVTS